MMGLSTSILHVSHCARACALCKLFSGIAITAGELTHLKVTLRNLTTSKNSLRRVNSALVPHLGVCSEGLLAASSLQGARRFWGDCWLCMWGPPLATNRGDLGESG